MITLNEGLGVGDQGLRFRVHAWGNVVKGFEFRAAGVMTLQEWRFRDSDHLKRDRGFLVTGWGIGVSGCGFMPWDLWMPWGLWFKGFGFGAARVMTLQEWRFRDSNDAERWVHREHAHRLVWGLRF